MNAAVCCPACRQRPERCSLSRYNSCTREHIIDLLAWKLRNHRVPHLRPRRVVKAVMTSCPTRQIGSVWLHDRSRLTMARTQRAIKDISTKCPGKPCASPQSVRGYWLVVQKHRIVPNCSCSVLGTACLCSLQLVLLPLKANRVDLQVPAVCLTTLIPTAGTSEGCMAKTCTLAHQMLP